jgi:hypothetical protein
MIFFCLIYFFNLSDDVFEEKNYFSHKMMKIGSWRSLRISSAKVDFSRFMYCFGRFSAKHRILRQSRTA